MVLTNVFLIISEAVYICKYLLNILISIFVKYLFALRGLGGAFFKLGYLFFPQLFFCRDSLYILYSSFD